MNKQKQILAVLFLGIFMISMMSTVSAAIAFVNPTASQFIPSGTFMVNVTYAASDIKAVTNFSDGNSSIFFNNVMFSTYTGNRGCDATNCWALIRSDDTGISEGTYLLKVSLGNVTNKWYANQTQTITIDRTNPSLDIKETSVRKGVPINYKCSDTNINAFSVSDGTTTTNLIKSSSDYVQFIPVLDGTYTFTCTDLAGNSASEAITVTQAEGFAQPPKAISTTNLKIQNFFSNPIVWVLIVAAILIFLNKKK